MSEPDPIAKGSLYRLLDCAPDFIARLDLDLRYRWVNKTAVEMTGIPREEWIGRTSLEIGFDPDTVAPGRAATRKALETGVPQETLGAVELRGRTRWLEMRVVPEYDEDGKAVGLILVTRDVTERRAALRRLAETSRLLTRTLESLTEAVFVVETEHRTIVDCNRAAEDMFGWSREELVGGGTRALHRDADTHRRFGSRSEKALREEGVFRGHFVMRRRDGSTFPTEHTVTLLDPDEGLEGGVVSTVRDRTDEVEAARELHRYNRRLRALHDLDRAILEAGTEEEVAAAAARHALEITGCIRASVTLTEPGMEGARLMAVRGAGAEQAPEGSIVSLCPWPGASLALGEIQRVDDILALPEPRPDALASLAEGGIRSLVSVPVGKSEELMGALNLSFSEPGGPGPGAEEVAREMADHLTLGVSQIRLRRAVEEETRVRLEAQERAKTVQIRLEDLLDDLNVGIIRAELDGTILETNAAARRMLGLEADESLEGDRVEDFLVPGESWQRILRQVRGRPGGSSSVQARILRANGTTGWASALGRIVEGEDGSVFVEGVVEDATEEMRLRREIVEISAQERLRIGQDLHDDLGQHLTGLAFLARDLRLRLEEDGAEERAADARELERLSNVAVRKTRHLARGVQPAALQRQGLVGALEEMARDVADLFGLRVGVEADRDVPTASVAEAGHLFRIAQEATTNAARHGGASAVSIRWRAADHGRILEVEDDGRGFPDEIGREGVGLRIMRYRARLVGGDLLLGQGDSAGGARVRVELPFIDTGDPLRGPGMAAGP